MQSGLKPGVGLRWHTAKPFEPDPGHAGEGNGALHNPHFIPRVIR